MAFVAKIKAGYGTTTNECGANAVRIVPMEQSPTRHLKLTRTTRRRHTVGDGVCFRPTIHLIASGVLGA